MFKKLQEIVLAVSVMVRPPERLTVSEAAEKYVVVNNPGSYVGPLSHDIAPYLVEPMNTTTSLDLTGMIFVGPAQSGKSEMVLHWLTYTAMCDPADMMIIEKDQASARDFSQRRVSKLYRNSPRVAEALTPGRNNQNTFDTRFKSGMLLTLSWPTVSQLSGKPISRLWILDYDRIDEDLGGEGDAYSLAKKRATSFRRYGMTVAESSPGRDVENPKWLRTSPHEAPPTKGILALYNRGDRRRWYWRCPHCSEPFEGDFSLLRWPDCEDPMEAAEKAVMHCPNCDGVIKHDGDPEKGIPGKYELNLSGKWVPDRMKWEPDDTLSGDPFRTDTASFWLKGVAAAFTTWKILVYNYLKAEEVYEKTGDQGPLRTTVNTDQGLPYEPKGAGQDRLPEELKSRSMDLGEKVVPEGVRYLIATIDIQKNRFVVQVQGFGVGGDIWVVDRFDIKKSTRTDADGERYWVSPHSYPEDWHQLADAVINKEYPLADGSGRMMAIKAVGCDSAGREGVTANAYAFWRWLRDTFPGDLHRRTLLTKGAAMKTAPRVQISYPDSDRKDRKAGARGEVPVMLINTDQLKDQVNYMLDRTDPFGGKVYFPDWLPDWWYTELVAETKTDKGWKNLKNHRNEAWDLLVYALAVSLSRVVNAERIDWDNPPSWAKDWDENDLVRKPEQNKRFETEVKAEYNLSKLGELLA